MGVEETIKEIAGELERIATTKTVVGDPITAAGKTIIPVSKLTMGFGGGGGEGKKEKESGYGGGGGAGAKIGRIASIPGNWPMKAQGRSSNRRTRSTGPTRRPSSATRDRVFPWTPVPWPMRPRTMAKRSCLILSGSTSIYPRSWRKRNACSLTVRTTAKRIARVLLSPLSTSISMPP